MKRLLISLAAGICLSATPAGAASPTPGPSPSTVPTPSVGDVWISEVLPNPIGTDTGSEWVELSNQTNRPLDISGLVVVRISGSTVLTVPSSTVLEAGKYRSFLASGSIINGGDTLILKGSTEYDQITYDAAGLEGQSWARLSETIGTWTDQPTPDAANVIVEVDDLDETVGASAASSTTNASSTTKKAASTKAAKASKLPKSGPGLAAYLIPLLAWAGYAYGRKFFKDRADSR